MIARRTFLKGFATTGAASVTTARWISAAEPPPETTTLRLLKGGSICWAPQYVAEDLLKAEGFTEVTYVTTAGGPVSGYLASRKADIALNFVGPNLVRVDQGDAVVFLAGVHVGCFEVFGTQRIRRVRDLKGKTIGARDLTGADYVFLASILASVGLDPRKDVTWALNPPPVSVQLLTDGKIDALIGFPPGPQELRANKVGHVVLNSATDRPWSQYFCCLATGSREFVRKHPVATKRALRAILKAADACAQQPEAAARLLVDRKYATRHDLALQVMKELPYNRWREYNPEDTLRFYALRLHEAGMIRSSPQKLLAQSADWRFLEELKRELKG